MFATGRILARWPGPSGTGLAARVDWLVIPAVLALAAGAALTDPRWRAVALVVGATLLAIVGLVKARGWSTDLSDRWHRRILLGFLDHDTTPSFLLTDDHAVVWMNGAGRALCPDAERIGIAAALRPLTNEAPGLLRRLEAGLRAARITAEDVVIRRGHARIVLRRQGGRHRLLRLEALNERAGAGLASVTNVPLMTVSRTGTVLSMNDALRARIGHRVRHLDRILADPLPVESGPARLLTARGEDMVHLYVTEICAGRREVAVLPLGSELPIPLAPDIVDGLDALPVALLKLGRDGRLLRANRAACKLLNLPAGAPDTHLGEVLTGLGRAVDDWINQALDAPVPPSPEVLRVRGPGQEAFVQVTLGRSVEDGAPVMIAILNDATELKTLEAQFVQSQKMQAIGQLAGGVAHDFNNLLTAITGHCDLLLLRHDVDDPDYADLVQINQNANRAASLVGQLLAYSRKQTLMPEVLDVRDALSDLTHLLNRLVGEKVTLSLYHDPALPMIRADKRQLEQVLMNLVVNARDAMPGGGDIVLETRQVILDRPQSKCRVTLPAGDYVCILVRDTGQGIPPDIISKVFDPFFTTKRPGEGTGLGLSTAYGIVKQSGGFIFADSVPGQGTEFSIYFPAHSGGAGQVAPVPQPAAPQLPDGAAEGLILLAEDEAPVRAFAARALRLQGYTVIEAENAEDALETLDNPALSVDLIVTDVVMPGLDGPSWVRRAQEGRPNLKIVFVSGYAEDLMEGTGASVPNSVFLPKPFSLAQLTETVRGQLGAESETLR